MEWIIEFVWLKTFNPTNEINSIPFQFQQHSNNPGNKYYNIQSLRPHFISGLVQFRFSSGLARELKLRNELQQTRMKLNGRNWLLISGLSIRMLINSDFIIHSVIINCYICLMISAPFNKSINLIQMPIELNKLKTFSLINEIRLIEFRFHWLLNWERKLK